MNEFTLKLVTGFLEAHLDDFGRYLSHNEIEESESGIIIEEMKELTLLLETMSDVE